MSLLESLEGFFWGGGVGVGKDCQRMEMLLVNK